MVGGVCIAKLKKRLILVLLILIVIVAAGILIGYKQKEPPTMTANPDLMLSNYPKLFEKDVIIVVGENASQIEMEGARVIAGNLYNLTRNVPEIKKDVKIKQDEKAMYNLILVGRPDTNNMLRDIKVTGDYSGARDGVIEILRNPWNKEKALLLVTGSDERIIISGIEMLSQFKVKEMHTNVTLIALISNDFNNIKRINLESTQPWVFQEKVVININNYEINFTSGFINIPGATQYVFLNEPILPRLFVKKTLPYGSNISNMTWNETASECIRIDNNVPIAGIASSEVNIEGSFSYNGFYPSKPYASTSSLTFGGGGVEVNTIISPVQYNSQTGKTKICKRMIFEIQYNITDTGVLVINLSTDKQQYSLKDNVTLNITLSNAGEGKKVDLKVILREFNRNEYSVNIGSTYLPDKSNESKTFTINLREYPLSKITRGIIETELIVIDARNETVLASEIIAFKVEKLNQSGGKQ